MNLRKATFVFSALLTASAMLASAQQDASIAQETPQTQQAAPQAQTGAPAQAPQGHGRPLKQLQQQLNLSPQQMSQLRPIFKDRAAQMKALRADTTLAPADRKAKAQSIQADSKTKIEAVLNDQQKQQYEQILAARKAQRAAKAGAGTQS
jgi:periplasmic protein CpxP/Spy